MLFVGSVGRRPLSRHDRRLTPVLPVPDPVQRVIERLHADDPPLYTHIGARRYADQWRL